MVLAGGAAGGSTIISGNTQVARNVLVSPIDDTSLIDQDYGMSAGKSPKRQY